jgi:uncharacterized protein YwgA
MAEKKVKINEPETNALLANLGIIFPRTEEELDSIVTLESERVSVLNSYHINPSLLIKGVDLPKETSKSGTKLKSTSKSRDYFKRAVLAAEITSQLYDEPTFGHVKLQKLIFLCENMAGLDFNNMYSKQAAGPYDHKFMHSIDQQFQRQKWFEVKTEIKSGYTKCTYIPSLKFNDHQKYYATCFKSKSQEIQYVIDIFRIEKTRFVELIATLFSCWQELIKTKKMVNDQSLVTSLYAWSKEKAKYKEDEVLSALTWMKKNGFAPSNH